MHTKENIYLQNEDNNLDSLTNDLLFKKTYGNPHNINALEHLLESYFDYPDGFLKEKLAVNYESVLEKTRLNDKSIRGDLIVIVDNNLFVNLEMYSEFTKDSLRKSKTYIMRIYSTQLNRGDDYSQIKKVTQINFVDNAKIKIDEEVLTEHYLINKELSDDFELDIARLDLIDKKGYNLSNRFRKQLEFLSAKSYEERESIAKGDEILMDLNAWLEEYKNDESLRECFDEKKWARFEGYHNGHDEGYEEGHSKGIEQGENNKAFKIAKNLLKTNLSLEEISIATNLSLEEIKKLQTKNTTEM